MNKPENISKLAIEIKSSGAKKVLLQLPEGLKFDAADILSELKKHDIDAIVSGGATYGACDIKDKEAKQAGCDLLVHVGHNKFYKDFDTEVPVVYFPWSVDMDFDNADFSVIAEKRIGLVTSIQHAGSLGSLKKMLEDSGKEAVIGGQILGCSCAAADKIDERVDAFLFAGSGDFNSLALKTEKPIYILNTEKEIVEKLDKTQFEKRRYASIFNAQNAKTFAVLLSTKKGQKNLMGNANDIVEYLKRRDKKAFIIVMDDVTDNDLKGLKVDAFVNTACPRLMDDTWSKPFINANDIEKVFEE
ncbi:diphthamide biosynthesis enzyme Dph2 [archaeon]|nr:diphthamide biosynthesis enzyme Dph2 [archaeon]